MTAILLPRHIVEKPWGRTILPAGFPEGDRKVGEIWYDLTDNPLPVLVKWLFTSERLSVQVHPNDVQAQARGLPSGKEECWIVIDAEPGATLGIGTKRALSASDLREASQTGEIEELLDWKAVSPGDWFFIPAGTVHAIGAGITLVEVQQNADVTYRLYDYGRPRELHLDDGVAVSNAAPYRGAHGKIRRDAQMQGLITDPNFSIKKITGGFDASGTARGQILVVPIEGSIDCEGIPVRPGEVAHCYPCRIDVASDPGTYLLIDLPKKY